MKLATLCYVKANGKTLMLHRVKKAQDMHAGKWNGLGGKLDPGETPEACAIREVWEESGLQVRNPELRGILTFPAFSKNEDWYVFLFVMREFMGELIDSDEGILAWIEDHKVLDLNLWPGDKIFLKWLDQDRFFSGKFVYDDGELVDHDVIFYPRIATGPEPGRYNQRVAKAQSDFKPIYQPEDDTYCWMCHGAVS